MVSKGGCRQGDQVADHVIPDIFGFDGDAGCAICRDGFALLVANLAVFDELPDVLADGWPRGVPVHHEKHFVMGWVASHVFAVKVFQD